MKKLFLSILFICSLLGGNAYAKVKLQCQGLVEIVEKNIIYVNFDEKFIEIIQGSGGNKVSFEVNTVDETHVKSWNRPLEKNAKHIIKSGEVLTYDTFISDWNEWYSADFKDRFWAVYIDRLQGAVQVGYSKESYIKSNKDKKYRKKIGKKGLNIEWELQWKCKKYGLSESKF
jgi:hypothetical protein